MMTVIGITGPTGAGKTTALEVLKRFGFRVIDCDALYHEMLTRPSGLIDKIAVAFPQTLKDGVFDRKALGKIVFSDEKELERLNAITDRSVFEEVESIIAGGGDDVAIDAIRLIESGLGSICRVTVGVTASREKRAERITLREGIDMEYALLRIHAQKTEEFYLENCDAVLVNDYESREEFEKECTAFFEDLLRRYRDGR